MLYLSITLLISFLIACLLRIVLRKQTGKLETTKLKIESDFLKWKVMYENGDLTVIDKQLITKTPWTYYNSDDCGVEKKSGEILTYKVTYKSGAIKTINEEI